MPDPFDFSPIDATSAEDSTVIKRLGPGAPGTRRWMERYGDNLVCVRYRQDKNRQRRYTTVEIVVSEREYKEPCALVRIAFEETSLRQKAREMGGKWVADRKLWRLPQSVIKALGLEKRIVEKCQ